MKIFEARGAGDSRIIAIRVLYPEPLSPASRARLLWVIRSWGLRPRLYACVRSADFTPFAFAPRTLHRLRSLRGLRIAIARFADSNKSFVVFNSIRLQELNEFLSK